MTFIIPWHGKGGRKSIFVWRTTEPHKMTDCTSSSLQSFALSSQHNAKDKQQDVAMSQGCIPQWTGRTGNGPTPKPQRVKLETRLRLFTLCSCQVYTEARCAHLLSWSTRPLFDNPKLNLELEGVFKSHAVICGCSPVVHKLTFSGQLRVTFTLLNNSWMI